MATDGELIWGNLLHLSYNFWADWEWSTDGKHPHLAAKPYLRFDDSLWDHLLKAMADGGLNMVVMDLGDCVRYSSHPEIAVKDAWSVDRLRGELAKMRALGLEPIPKLNFSTCHDQWLGKYSRMVSTPEYYDVCRDLILEVIDIFDNPRFFHLGMDEEQFRDQRNYEYVVIRQFDLWWRDLFFLTSIVESRNARPWIWSDYAWSQAETFYNRMPTSILQSNWYYDSSFEESVTPVKTYLDLEGAGYDQVPTLSNWTALSNIVDTVKFSQKRMAPEHLKGFLLAPWRPTLEEWRHTHVEALNEFIKARQVFLDARRA